MSMKKWLLIQVECKCKFFKPAQKLTIDKKVTNIPTFEKFFNLNKKNPEKSTVEISGKFPLKQKL